MVISQEKDCPMVIRAASEMQASGPVMDLTVASGSNARLLLSALVPATAQKSALSVVRTRSGHSQPEWE